MKDKWIEAYLDVASRFAQLSPAKRLQVGAVIVKDHRVVSIGYNGTPAGWDNVCEVEVSEEIEVESRTVTRSHLVTKPEVIHAEANAITKLAKSNDSGADAELFCTHAPCIDCAKLIYGSGIKKVYYREIYRSSHGVEFLTKSGIDVVHRPTDGTL